MTHSPKYTRREKHLLMVIANLRGSASDAWSRLNCLVTRRGPRTVHEALEEHAQADELREGEEQLRTPLLGAGLPWSEPHKLPLDEALRQESTLDERAKWSKEKLIMSGAPKS